MDTEVSAFQFYAMNKTNDALREQKKTKKSKKKLNKNSLKEKNSTEHHCQINGTDKKRKRNYNKNKTKDVSREIDESPQRTKKRKVFTSAKKEKAVNESSSKISSHGKIVKNSNDSSDDIRKEKSKKHKKHDCDVEDLTELEFDINESSVEQGKDMLRWIIAPLEEEKFFSHNWEQRPVHIIRHSESYYKTLLSCEMINKALRNRMLYFGKNIDITSYENGERKTHNPDGRANAPIVWDFYNNGCSVRILNPQTFFNKIHEMNAKLQEFFGCFVGANVYLTPPDSQGFAPHYDDIEAFVLQIEGKKRWKLYGPRTEAEILPRESSPNFKEEDLGPVTMEVTLEAGDLLYFPRGVIHQASAVDGCHSLHITLSVYQKNSWADLLEKLIPVALNNAIEEDVSFRKGLPLDYLNHMGVVNSDVGTPQRAEFLNTLQNLICKLVNYAPVDAACDQMGKKFMIDALPPCLTKEERCRTVFGDGEIIKNGAVSNVAEMQLDTRIRLLRYNALRLVTEDEDRIVVYYSINNSREYHREEPQSFEVDEDTAPAIEYLIQSYPEFVCVEDLPVQDEIKRVQIAATLWEVGLVITEEPLAYESD